MVAKRKVNFFVFFSWGRHVTITGHLISANNSVNFVGTLRSRCEKKSFGLEQKEVITARLGTCLHLSSIDHVVVVRCYKLHSTGQVKKKIRLSKFLFVNLLCFAY